MGNFYVDDKYAFKKEWKIRDQCCVVCFFFYVVKNGASNGTEQWHEIIREIIRVVKNSKLSI
jgi:hypothetical protein